MNKKIITSGRKVVKKYKRPLKYLLMFTFMYICMYILYFGLREVHVTNSTIEKNNETTTKINSSESNFNTINDIVFLEQKHLIKLNESNKLNVNSENLLITKKETIVTKENNKTKNKIKKKKKKKIRKKKETKKVLNYSLPGNYDDNLYWLSRIIYAEGGSDYCTDELQLLIGSVIINRINSDKYPNTMYGVIFQSGQYQPTWSGSIYNEPDSRTIENARKLLNEGPINDKIVFQAEFSQGNYTYKKIDIYAGNKYMSTMYFCY